MSSVIKPLVSRKSIWWLY